MYCSNCGQELTDEKTKFCTNCGAMLQADEEQAEEKYHEESAAEEPEGEKALQAIAFEADHETDKKSAQKKSAWQDILKVGRILKIIPTIIIALILLGWFGKMFIYGSFPIENMMEKNEVTAQELADAYSIDFMNAEATYIGKPIIVTGEVINKGQFNNSNNVYAVLQSSSENDYSVIVSVDFEDRKKINELNIGDIIEVTGVCQATVEQEDGGVSIQIAAKKIK